MNHRSTLSVVLVIAGFLALPAIGAGVITDGDAVFEFKDSTTPGLCNFMPDGVGGSDHMYQNWWWMYDMTSGVVPFTWPAGEEYNGNTAQLTGGGGGLGWRMTVVLTDGDNPGEATLTETVVFMNGTNGLLGLDLYAYSDIDAGGTSSGDEAVLVDDEIVVTDTELGAFATVGYAAELQMPFPLVTSYQVGEYSDVRDLLSGSSPVDLDNSGLPFGPGDFTGAFQWSTSLAPHCQATFTRTTTLGVPEPTTMVLMLAGAVLLRNRRR